MDVSIVEVILAWWRIPALLSSSDILPCSALHKSALDLIVGGPPCQSFTGINANRGGVNSEEGLLFVNFGHFINNVMAHPLQRGERVFFFAENVVLRSDDLEKVEEPFKCPFFVLDAQYWSPCSRKRIFFTNLRCPNEDPSYEKIGARKCLKKNWELPGDRDISEPHPGVKANTCMASLGRIDDDRMTVVTTTNQGVCTKRTFSVVEREKLMGYPPGYTERSVKYLYDALKPACTSMDKKYKWKEELAAKYHIFSGVKVKLHGLGWYHANPEDPCIQLKLAPPQTGKEPSFFHAAEYAKHLIGNAYPVPVAVALLSPLEDFVKSASYAGYHYSYAWEN
jgi:site-specific DNA-cytosine methylase